MGPGSPDSPTIRFEGPMNDTKTALYTQTASPSLACTLTSITTTTFLSFHKSFLVISATVSTTHSARAGAAREKKEDKKWRLCRSHSSTKLRWCLIRNYNRRVGTLSHTSMHASAHSGATHTMIDAIALTPTHTHTCTHAHTHT